MARIGVDFGTSNSSVSVFDGQAAQILPIDPRARRPELYRSVIFFPEEGEVCTGGRAITEYLEQGQGRLVQSVKAFLPSRSFTGTQIRGKIYRLEELVAVLLRRIREAAEKALGEPARDVVLGRPARFSLDPDADATAQKRLTEAARIAGFESIAFEIEPIAAALAYEASLDAERLVLVGDFGAGTSDFTLMRLGPNRQSADRKKDILGTSGVPIGGDRFDSAIMEHKLLHHFGAGSTYQLLSNRMPMPPSILSKLLSWHEMSFIKDRSVQQLLDRIKDGSDRPAAVEALKDLVDGNLGFALFQKIEAAKVLLSDEKKAHISFSEGGVDLEENLARGDFERWTAALRGEMDGCIGDLLERTGLSAGDVDLVVLTGGSSQVPSIRELFVKRFGESKLRQEEAFISVAAGLGLAAHASEARA